MKKDRVFEIVELGILGLILLLLHSQVGLYSQDDLFFREILNRYESVYSFVTDRYENWSSRVLIEALLVSVLSLNEWVWRVIDTLMLLLCVYAISEIALPEGKRKYAFVVGIAIFAVPVSLIHSAGYGATTINYVWPLAMGLLTSIPIANSLKQQKTNIGIKVAGVFAALYAANLEQMAAILAGISAYLVIEKLAKKQKQDLYAIIILLIAFGMIIFALTCPGNKGRAETELLDFPVFKEYSFFEKMELGILSIGAYYFAIVEENFTLGILLIACVIAMLRQKNYLRILLLLPSIITFIYYRCVVQGILQAEKEEKTITVLQNIYPSRFSDYSKGYVVVEVIFYLVLFITLGMAIYLLNGKGRKGFLCNLILLAGVLSRLAVSFSSSVLKSGYRTILFCSVSILIVALLLIEPSLPGKKYE